MFHVQEPVDSPAVSRASRLLPAFRLGPNVYRGTLYQAYERSSPSGKLWLTCSRAGSTPDLACEFAVGQPIRWRARWCATSGTAVLKVNVICYYHTQNVR